MKNVHVLPTYKPSSLFRDIKGKLGFNTEWTEFPLGRKNQHIYITNDEKVKDGDWFINTFNDNQPKLQKRYGDWITCYNQHKIILTTDPELIADGVQAIDNEFLEWFVKNPSCEFVEVEKVDTFKKTNEVYVDEITGGNYYEVNKKYKIIIPQEVSKQQTAVDWLWEQVDEILPFSVDTETGIKLYNAKEQAKEMEKEQHKHTFEESRLTHPMVGFKHDTFSEYYNETFNTEQP
jgi:hypothetical protein